MNKLGDIAAILRSKNAGPLFVTMDVMFAEKADYDRVKKSGVITKTLISSAYGVEEQHIDIIYYDIVDSLKVTIPRKNISGSLQDDDIYGCQQQMELYNIMIP